MWEGDPVGVDQKRPLVGFALVSVLCAVLMALSVGRGWSLDLFHPGKPIAAPDSRVEVDPEPPARPDGPRVVTIPAELEPQPLAAAAATPPSSGGKGASVGRSEDRDREGPETVAEETEGLAGDDNTNLTPTQTTAETKAATRAALQAEKAAARLERLAEQAAEQAAQNAADKAAEEAAEEAERLAEAATQAAAQAEHQAEVAAAQAAHLSDRLLRQVQPTGL
jgi:hypothetical protein